MRDVPHGSEAKVTPIQVAWIHAGIRSAQFCAFLALVLFAHDYGWWVVPVIPVIALMVWAWQVLYENIP